MEEVDSLKPECFQLPSGDVRPDAAFPASCLLTIHRQFLRTPVQNEELRDGLVEDKDHSQGRQNVSTCPHRRRLFNGQFMTKRAQ